MANAGQIFDVALDMGLFSLLGAQFLKGMKRGEIDQASLDKIKGFVAERKDMKPGFWGLSDADEKIFAGLMRAMRNTNNPAGIGQIRACKIDALLAAMQDRYERESFRVFITGQERGPDDQIQQGGNQQPRVVSTAYTEKDFRVQTLIAIADQISNDLGDVQLVLEQLRLEGTSDPNPMIRRFAVAWQGAVRYINESLCEALGVRSLGELTPDEIGHKLESLAARLNQRPQPEQLTFWKWFAKPGSKKGIAVRSLTVIVILLAVIIFLVN